MKSTYIHFDGMSWPVPCERMDVATWELVYGTPSHEDKLLAASVMNAYAVLIRKPAKERTRIAQRIKNIEKVTRGES
jgi:hypothetical protein